MSVLNRLEKLGMEKIVFCHDRGTGLKAIIAIHDTTLGPALGGTRMRPYPTEEEALEDVCKLACSMSYKAALAGLDLGGGKAVIIGDPVKDKTEALLRAFGRFVNRLGGSYITSADMNINQEDVDLMSRETPFAHGGLPQGGRGGSPSPTTAYGVFKGIEACLEARGENPSLTGKKVVVQGLGNVGRVLCGHLAEAGASLTVCDIDKEKLQGMVKAYGAVPCSPEEAHRIECDILSPCAAGGIINPETIKEINCRIIAGGANNVLSDISLGEELHQRGILYASDYVINAGGLIHVAYEKTHYLKEEIMAFVAGIKVRLLEIFKRSAAENLPPCLISEQLAKERIAAGRKLLALRKDF